MPSNGYVPHRELEEKVADLETRYSRAGVAAERREMRAEVAEAQRLRQAFEKQAVDMKSRLQVGIPSRSHNFVQLIRFIHPRCVDTVCDMKWPVHLMTLRHRIRELQDNVEL